MTLLDDSGLLDLAGYFGSLRVNLTGQPLQLSERQAITGRPGAIQVLNPAAFSRPVAFNAAPAFLLNGQVNPAYTAFYADPTRFFGTAPAVLTDARTDPFSSEDFSILKRTHFTETMILELGAEFFNVFNRLRYGFPGTDFRNTGDFGVITVNPNVETQQPRRIQLRARFIF